MSNVAFVSFGRENLEEAQLSPLLARFERRYPGRVERMNWWENRRLHQRLRKWNARHRPSHHALFGRAD